MSSNLTFVRLQKEELRLSKNPIKNAVVKRKGVLNFHFVLFDLDGDYTGGYYHGVLELPTDYPFSPPKLKFFTPSGRFEVDTPICTTFTNFHKESWSTAWNVETLVHATISFMQSEVRPMAIVGKCPGDEDV
jgi:ubiquitin-conjugating enzyme E2 J2